ncbi:MAG: outer membrane protein W, partial [Arcticibacterium sp.]
GINIRKYFQYGDKAFDVNIGTYGWFYGQHRKYRDGGYHLLDNRGKFTSSQPVGAMVQGIYSWHFPIGKTDALKAYYGFGGQVNYRTYVSEDNLVGTNQNGEKHISLGPAAAAGLEYNLPGNDLGIFLDGGGYLELAPDLLFSHPQFSAGVRVNILGNK